LTMAGNSYPWYLKESIVWPQADLRTSTMPNFVLDHVELEDLMTFLLAQKGPSQAVSKTAYKVSVQQWEAGKKMPWEEPIPPSKIHDLRFAMTVFATEGCASCHRLEGFESTVGFRIEKTDTGEKKPDFDKLYQEHQWFRKLFPEDIQGSAIVRTLQSNAAEIDAHIAGDVRQGALLEEIEKEFPEVIESFYSNFRYAQRARNHEDQLNSIDPEKKKVALAELEAWKERVHHVLMMYIQEYGLGRLIGPRPNWSGVYRSDEWLMEHFHNPSSHVPRSIMPVFPFDDTRFYALTYMLDVLGKRNRDAVRTIWEHRGFDPSQAYQLFCSQCHGTYLQGDGPVATWIYPIPKNLRSSEFMRNLTRGNAIESVIHGVKGTPMPPWGETPQPKPDYDSIPVLSMEEVVKLVDWLFSSLPGGNVIKGGGDIPKWHYTPQDVIEELKQEGNQLESGEEYKGKASSMLVPPVKEIYYASLKPVVTVSRNDKNLADNLFDVIPNPIQGEEETKLYYIKHKYYTKANIDKGQAFFELNCAACHGKEADGMGMRASIMFDAKPRMLTNFDWLKSRDDLRLLRSIKYGVHGTAMTPWGDLTSSLQRLQLVIYIRSLSAEKEQRDALLAALYASFDVEMSQVELARIQEYSVLESLQQEIMSVEKERRENEKKQDGKQSLDATVELYKKQLQLTGQAAAHKAVDDQLVKLKDAISQQRDLYQGIGSEFISVGADQAVWQKFLQLIALQGGRFTLIDGKISQNNDKEKQAKSAALIQEIASGLDEKERKKFLEKILSRKSSQ
ncbi:MAG: c-type cytochrome, partial [Parachlamydiaceae bacterium]